ncbi:MAG: AraC family transcriptional regulator [Steroidobacteraceae bacterium]
MGRRALDQQDFNTAQVFELVHARILRFFPDLVAELGGDAKVLMRSVGIDAESFSDGKAGATYRQMVHLIELAAAQLRCPDFGMRLAKRQSGGGMFGPLGLVMKNSKTFGDALQYVSEHTYAHSLAARIWLRRSGKEKTLFAGHDILLKGMPNKSQAMEQILLAGHLSAMQITGGRARVRRVHFRHQPVSSLRVYRRYFGCEIRFAQNEDGVVFSDLDLKSPIVDPDLAVYRRATSFIDAKFTRRRPPLDAQVRGVIMQCLGTARCRNERIAAELNLHPKTMQRMLKADGTSFQKIKDEVRRDLMLYYLTQTKLDFARLAERLGFTEQSVLTRYCNRWFSKPPTKLRSQCRSLARSR